MKESEDNIGRASKRIDFVCAETRDTFPSTAQQIFKLEQTSESESMGSTVREQL